MPSSRRIDCVDVTKPTTPECLKWLNAELQKRKVAEADVISVQCAMDDASVTVWAYYWRD